MTNIEIKKALYKQKPIAEFEFIRVGVAYYGAIIKSEENKDVKISFQVPINDMGDADYLPQMDAKLLNRYISE